MQRWDFWVSKKSKLHAAVFEAACVSAPKLMDSYSRGRACILLPDDETNWWILHNFGLTYQWRMHAPKQDNRLYLTEHSEAKDSTGREVTLTLVESCKLIRMMQGNDVSYISPDEIHYAKHVDLLVTHDRIRFTFESLTNIEKENYADFVDKLTQYMGELGLVSELGMLGNVGLVCQKVIGSVAKMEPTGLNTFYDGKKRQDIPLIDSVNYINRGGFERAQVSFTFNASVNYELRQQIATRIHHNLRLINKFVGRVINEILYADKYCEENLRIEMELQAKEESLQAKQAEARERLKAAKLEKQTVSSSSSSSSLFGAATRSTSSSSLFEMMQQGLADSEPANVKHAASLTGKKS